MNSSVGNVSSSDWKSRVVSYAEAVQEESVGGDYIMLYIIFLFTNKYCVVYSNLLYFIVMILFFKLITTVKSKLYTNICINILTYLLHLHTKQST